MHRKSDGRLYNITRLRANTKVCVTIIRDVLFADDAAVTSHTEQDLQCLMDRFYQACKDFGLTISLKKTNVLGQDVNTSPVITINNYKLEVVQQFTYLGSTISENMSLDAEINKPIGKAARTLGQLIIQVWENPKLTTPAKIVVYNGCIVSTLLKGSETLDNLCQARARGTKRPMFRFLPVPASPQCIRCSDNVDCAGLVMSAV